MEDVYVRAGKLRRTRPTSSASTPAVGVSSAPASDRGEAMEVGNLEGQRRGSQRSEADRDRDAARKYKLAPHELQRRKEAGMCYACAVKNCRPWRASCAARTPARVNAIAAADTPASPERSEDESTDSEN